MGAYGINAQQYLERCRDRLLEATESALFYAAFELRCCVEARLYHYLEHLKPYEGKKIQKYKVGENAKKIERIHKGQTIAMVKATSEEGREIIGYHTPVPQQLRRFTEQKLNKLCHAQTHNITMTDEWWATQRKELTEAYRVAWLACQGNLPVPPLWDKKTGQPHNMIFMLRPDETEADYDFMTTGASVRFYIDYLDEPPVEWVCDF